MQCAAQKSQYNQMCNGMEKVMILDGENGDTGPMFIDLSPI